MLATVAAVLIVLELFVRWLAPGFPPPNDWYSDEARVKVDQMETLAESEPVDVVFAGQSMMLDAIDPEVFTQSDPGHRTAYNAALSGGFPQIMARWIPEEVVPRARPATVVIGLSALDFNANGRVHTSVILRYEEAPEQKKDVFGVIDRFARKSVYLFRYRLELRNIGNIVSVARRRLSGFEAPPPDPPPLGEFGESDRPNLAFDCARDNFCDRLRSDFMNDYTLSTEAVAALESLVTELQEREVRPVILILPHTDEFETMLPTSDYERFEAAIDDVSQEQGVPVVDASGAMPDLSAFDDPIHLNVTGMERFSRLLPRLLESASIGVLP